MCDTFTAGTIAACKCRARFQTSLAQAKMHLLGIHPFKSLVGLLPHHELIFDRPAKILQAWSVSLGSLWFGPHCRSLADGINEPAFANSSAPLSADS